MMSGGLEDWNDGMMTDCLPVGREKWKIIN
jgi:hypothetical protein